MFTSEAKDLTDLSGLFVEPTNAIPPSVRSTPGLFRRSSPHAEAAHRFGYTPGSFRVLVHQFRQHPRRDFFLKPAKGPRSAPKTDPVRDRVIALRKEILSIYDISRNLADKDTPSVRSPSHRFSRTKDSRGCRAGLTMNDHPARSQPRPMSPMSGNLI